ncbi:MAG: branched-chain amino acid ABC transporter permease [Candidatus Bathyarchaeia archaeon]
MLEVIIIEGLIIGLILALVALGFTLVYGISGIINLAHGAYFVIGAYIYEIIRQYLSNIIPLEYYYLTPISSILITCAITSFIGSLFYRITCHHILGDEVAILIVSICSCIVFQQLIYISLGKLNAFSFRIEPIFPGKIKLINIELFAGQTIAALVSFAAFAVLSILILKTKTGKAMRALSQDVEAAMLMGISVERLYTITAAISSGLASLGGIFYTASITFGVGSYMWLTALALSFTVVILGGLGSIKGSLLGGLILGLTQIATMKIIPGSGVLQDSIPFIVIIVILLVRPKGLFGKRVEIE